MLVFGQMTFRWVNDENPEEFLDVPWFIVGSQEDPSQAFGSAITYCTRYFLTSFFSIAQPDSDPDAYRSKQKEAEAAEERAVTESIIAEIDKVVMDFATRHPDKKDAAKKLVEKYVKSGNYKAIKSPEVAGKLLMEAKEKLSE